MDDDAEMEAEIQRELEEEQAKKRQDTQLLRQQVSKTCMNRTGCMNRIRCTKTISVKYYSL